MAKSIIDQLASSLGKRDELPNIVLASKIAKSGNEDHLKELFSLVAGKKPAVRNDAIKVIYEIGERKPEMISKHVEDFISLLKHNDNRMIWGAMTALSSISKTQPKLLVPFMVDIVDAIDKGSVITRDHGIFILSHIATLPKQHKHCLELLLEQLEKAPVNQLPMYAEKTTEVVTMPFVKRMINTLEARTDVIEIPSKAKRIEKVIKQLKAMK
jgi:hypothetical protein